VFKDAHGIPLDSQPAKVMFCFSEAAEHDFPAMENGL